MIHEAYQAKQAQRLNELPPGFFEPCQAKRGRPMKEARDAAVFLAKLWRTREGHQSSSKANEWIVGECKFQGITEAAHVYAAIKRATQRGLKQSAIIVVGPLTSPNGLLAIESTSGAKRIQADSRAWLWQPGEKIALEGRVKITERERLYVSDVTQAIRSIGARHG